MVNSKYKKYISRRIRKEKNAIKKCKCIIDMVHEHCAINNEILRDDFPVLVQQINELEMFKMESMVKFVLNNVSPSIWKTDLEKYYFIKILTW